MLSKPRNALAILTASALCLLAASWTRKSGAALPAVSTNAAGHHPIADTCTNCTIDPSKLNGPTPPSKGGTGLSSVTAHLLPVGNGTLPFNLVPASLAGYVLTSNGPTIDPSFQAPISSNVNYSTCSTFSITAAAGTAQATGCTIFLSSAGTWKIGAHVRFALNAASNNGAFITFKFRRLGVGMDIADSQRISGTLTSSGSYNSAGTIPMEAVATITAGEIVEIYATRQNGVGTGFLTSQLVSDANGQTVIFSQQLLQ